MKPEFYILIFVIFGLGLVFGQIFTRREVRRSYEEDQIDIDLGQSNMKTMKELMEEQGLHVSPAAFVQMMSRGSHLKLLSNNS